MDVFFADRSTLVPTKMDVFFADRSTHRSGSSNIELRGCRGACAALLGRMDVFFADTGLDIWNFDILG